jgi:hypothetical protein
VRTLKAALSSINTWVNCAMPHKWLNRNLGALSKHAEEQDIETWQVVSPDRFVSINRLPYAILMHILTNYATDDAVALIFRLYC